MKDECKSFESCNAPMCPLDEEVGNYTWYPEEDVCGNSLYNKDGWIKNQRKYSRKSVEGYYTLEMLKRSCVITAGTKGLDPEKLEAEEKEQIKKWLKSHPVKRELTDEEKQERAELAKKNFKRL